MNLILGLLALLAAILVPVIRVSAFFLTLGPLGWTVLLIVYCGTWNFWGRQVYITEGGAPAHVYGYGGEAGRLKVLDDLRFCLDCPYLREGIPTDDEAQERLVEVCWGWDDKYQHEPPTLWEKKYNPQLAARKTVMHELDELSAEDCPHVNWNALPVKDEELELLIEQCKSWAYERIATLCGPAK